MNDNVVFTAASGYSEREVQIFVRSLRRHSNARIVMLTDDITSISDEFASRYDIMLVNVTQNYNKNKRVEDYCRYFKHGNKPILRRYMHFFQRLYFRLNRIDFHTRLACEFYLRGLPTVRFYEYYLLVNSIQFSKAIICDVRDVFFQADPFVELVHLEVFAEHKGVSIGSNTNDGRWNSRRITECFGSVVANDFVGLPISCCGVICGTNTTIRKYLEQLVILMMATSSWGVIDQAIHNVLVHSQPDNIMLYKSFEGRAVHLNRADNLGTLPLVDVHGEVIPILHQYDRHETLYRSVIQSVGT